MAIWTYTENAEKRNVNISLRNGSLILRVGTYANLTSEEVTEVLDSGVGAVLKEGIVPPATPTGGITKSNGTVIPPWAAFTVYAQYQSVTHEEKIYVAKKEFESGEIFKEENWTLISSGGGGSGVGKITLWAPETSYVENQLVVSPEGETLRTLKGFKSGKTYEF